MVTLFVGRLPPEVRRDEIQPLFEQFGRVTEIDLQKRKVVGRGYKYYGFVYMEDEAAAERAISHLNEYKLRGFAISVALSTSKIVSSSKLHVGNISSRCSKEELRAMFEKYGPVIKCRLAKRDAFVEMERGEDAKKAMKALYDTNFKGKRIYIELSNAWKDPRRHRRNCDEESHWLADRPKKRGDLEDGYSRDRSDPYLGSLRPISEREADGYSRDRSNPYSETVRPISGREADGYSRDRSNPYSESVRPISGRDEDGYSRDRSNTFSGSLQPVSGRKEQLVGSDPDPCGFIDYYAKYRTHPYEAAREPSSDWQPSQHSPVGSSTSESVPSGFERHYLAPPNAYYSRERSPLQRSHPLLPSSSRDSSVYPRLSPSPPSSGSRYEQVQIYSDSASLAREKALRSFY